MQFKVKTIDQWSYYYLPQAEQSGIMHGFMTKSSNSIISSGEDRQTFVRKLPARSFIEMHQEHGSAVHVVEGGERPKAGDGLVIIEKGAIGTIRTADCVPIIIYEPNRKIAAIIHAGWRGTVRKITRRAVQVMIGVGAIPARMAALIGPGIGPCCYNVGKDVEDAFHEAGFADVCSRREENTFLDLKKANRDILERQGVKTIHDVNLCTSCNRDLFFSARRDGDRGRQISFVLLQG